VEGAADQVMGLERERKLDMRIDGERLGRFTIAADARAGQIHGAEEGPDAHLKVRVPVKAGTRTISATFLKDTVLAEGIALSDREQAFFEGVGSVSVAGPYNTAGPGATPSRERVFTAVRRQRGAALRGKDHRDTRAAPRRPSRRSSATAALEDGVKRGGFEAAFSCASRSRFRFIFRVSRSRGAEPMSIA
jgi:hypothetical protein